VQTKQLIVYQTENNREPFTQWFVELDFKIRVRIRNRLDRLEQGQYGDYKSVGDGVYELRFFFGPGYRIYFAEDGHKVILLLCGGDKGSQPKDVLKAQQYWQSYISSKVTNRDNTQEDL
jgi:putative addiction module killer protein